MVKILTLDELTTQAAGDMIAIVDVSAPNETKRISITNLFQGIPVDVGIGVAPSFVEGGGLHIANATAPVLRLQDSNDLNSDWEIRSPSAGNRLEFFHVNTAKVQFSLSSAGKFGIHPGGYIAPDGTLHVHTATAGAVAAVSFADDLIVENSTDGGLSILVPDASWGYLGFGAPSDNDHAWIAAQQSSGAMRFTVGTAYMLQLLSTQIQSLVPIKILEAADDVADTATYGQLWVLNGDPNTLMYTDGDGTKFTVDVSAV